MIVLTDVVCYGWIIVLIGRGSVGGSCEISIRDLFCFPSVVCLPVSPMYTFSNWLHGILYTTPAFFCLSTLSFGWTKTCLREGGLRFNHCGYPVFSECTLYVLRGWVDIWDSRHSSWFFLCFIFLGFIFSNSLLPVSVTKTFLQLAMFENIWIQINFIAWWTSSRIIEILLLAKMTVQTVCLSTFQHSLCVFPTQANWRKKLKYKYSDSWLYIYISDQTVNTFLL